MRLKKLILNNIRSYRSQEISFPEGSMLLSGDIGSGKTSILLAIEYAFFGLQPGQRGSSLLSNGKEAGGVVLELELEGKDITIERTLKRGSKTVSQDYAAITIDGEKQEMSVTELKTRILGLLNYPTEFVKKTNLLYRYTVYSPQEEMKQIILEDYETRLNTLRHVFGIDKYKKIKENLQILASKLREKSRIMQVEVRDLETDLEKIRLSKERLDSLEENIGIKNAFLERKIRERKIVEEKLKETEAKAQERHKVESEIEKAKIIAENRIIQDKEHESEIKRLEFQISETKVLFQQKDLDEVVGRIALKREMIEKANKEYIEISGNLNSINLTKEEDLKKKNRIFKIDICPTCLQNVSEMHKHNILNATENQLAEAEKRIKELAFALQETSKKTEKEKSDLSNLEREKSELESLKIKTREMGEAKQRVKMLSDLRASAEKEINSLNEKIGRLKNSLLEFFKYDDILKAQQEKLRNAFNDEKNAEISLAELRKEKELLKKEIETLEASIEKKKKLRDDLIKITDIEKWLSTDFTSLIDFTERNILLKLRGSFSESFNKWFIMLTSDSFSAQLDENFTPVIMQGGYETDYSYLSGGERTAVALAYRLALNQIINSLMSKIRTRDLVILDEPTDGFSDQQLDKVRDILQELNAGQLILVSHEYKIEGFVDNVMKLNKEQGISALHQNI